MKNEMKLKCEELPLFVFVKEIEKKLISKLNYKFEYDLDIVDKDLVFSVQDPQRNFPTIFLRVDSITLLTLQVEFSRDIPYKDKMEFLDSLRNEEWHYLYFSLDSYGCEKVWEVSASYYMYLPYEDRKNISYAADVVCAMLYEFAEEAGKCEKFIKEWLDKKMSE